MKFRRIILLLVVCSFISSVFGDNRRFGKITKEELRAKYSKIDSTASAEILYEKGSLELDITGRSFVTRYKVHRIIKIYKKDAYKLGDISISYDENQERFTKFKACTYNLVGNKIVKTKVRKNEILKDNVIKDFSKRKVAMRDVKVGSIIEIEYCLRMPIKYSYRDWYFQRYYPVKYSEFTLRIPDIFTFHKDLKGYVPIDIKRESSSLAGSSIYENKYIFVGKNISAFKPEPNLMCPEDYISKLDFSLEAYRLYSETTRISPDWDSTCRNLRMDSNFGQVYANKNIIKKTLETIITDDMSEEVKVKKIFEFVRDNISWNKEFEICDDKSFRKILKDKVSNSGGKNLILIALYKAAGFVCNPVLLSTRYNGMNLYNTPDLHKYNNTIASLTTSKKHYYLDTYDKYSSMDMIDYYDLGNAVVVSEKNHQFVELKNKRMSKKMIFVNAEINENDELKGDYTSLYYHFDAASYRRSYVDKETRQEKLEKKYENFEIDDLEVLNTDKNSGVIQEKFKFVYDSDEEEDEDTDEFRFNSILGLDSYTNDFVSEKRIYPIDFDYPKTLQYSITLKYPDTYTLSNVPEKYGTCTPDRSILYSYSCNKLKGGVKINFIFKIGKIRYFVNEYPAIKAIQESLEKKIKELIVLKKNN
ncbi:DUF3857 domain-containing protein [Marinilabiliaceae bacterium JC040]|nr:DUF3857 domain-containing protein [Marinilabiliaceae bacterium JC040]